MKRFVLCLSLMVAASCVWSQRPKSIVPMADPFILVDGDTYYAYGTHNADGIEYYTSTDLQVWRPGSLALKKANTSEERWFWAPEVYHIGDQ